MTTIRGVILSVFVCLRAFGQASPQRVEFEVASIKPSAQVPPTQLALGVHIDGAQFTCNYFSLADYIRMAYRVKHYQISGPDWIASARFDIAAKLPAGATREQVPEMLKSLLAERFQMKLHNETKEFPVYGLVVAKGGLKMKESPAEADASSGGAGNVNVTASGGPGGVTVNFGRGSYFTFGNNKFEAKKMTMFSVADSLARFVDRPVVDMTDLKGNYDFTLEFSPEDYRAMLIRSAIAAGVILPPGAERALEGASGDSLFAAIQTLGLKLDSRKAPLEVLVIDHFEKNPSEN